MKRIQDDVTIDHDSEHKELRFGVASKAETVIDLVSHLFNHQEILCSLSQSLRLTQNAFMIPEMKQPQDLTHNYVKEQNKMQTKYQVMMDFTRNITTTTVIKDKDEKHYKK